MTVVAKKIGDRTTVAATPLMPHRSKVTIKTSLKRSENVGVINMTDRKLPQTNTTAQIPKKDYINNKSS